MGFARFTYLSFILNYHRLYMHVLTVTFHFSLLKRYPSLHRVHILSHHITHYTIGNPTVYNNKRYDKDFGYLPMTYYHYRFLGQARVLQYILYILPQPYLCSLYTLHSLPLHNLSQNVHQ